MQLLPVLAWIAAIYCAAGTLVVLAVALLARDQASADEAKVSRWMLTIFAAWPVVLAQMVLVGIHTTVQRFRARP